MGSWAAEAVARSGVAELVLIDLDHIAESNINRQVQAVGRSVGQAKGLALQARIADIHPGCRVHWVDDFVSPDNWRVISAIGSAERHWLRLLDTPGACHDSGLFHDTPRRPSSRALTVSATGAAGLAAAGGTGCGM